MNSNRLVLSVEFQPPHCLTLIRLRLPVASGKDHLPLVCKRWSLSVSTFPSFQSRTASVLLMPTLPLSLDRLALTPLVFPKRPNQMATICLLPRLRIMLSRAEDRSSLIQTRITSSTLPFTCNLLVRLFKAFKSNRSIPVKRHKSCLPHCLTSLFTFRTWRMILPVRSSLTA